MTIDALDTEYADTYAPSRAHRPDVTEVARGLRQLADFLVDHDLPPLYVRMPFMIILRGSTHEQFMQLGLAALIPDQWERHISLCPGIQPDTKRRHTSIERGFDGGVKLQITAVTEEVGHGADAPAA